MKVRRFIKWEIVVAVLILLAIFLGVPAYETGVLTIRHEEARIQSGDVEIAALTGDGRPVEPLRCIGYLVSCWRCNDALACVPSIAFGQGEANVCTMIESSHWRTEE